MHFYVSVYLFLVFFISSLVSIYRSILQRLFNFRYCLRAILQSVLNQGLEEIHTFFYFFLTTVYLLPTVSFAVDKKMFPNLLTQLSMSGCVIFILYRLSNCVSRLCIVFIFKLIKKSTSEDVKANNKSKSK
jgi:hypothetical protein